MTPEVCELEGLDRWCVWAPDGVYLGYVKQAELPKLLAGDPLASVDYSKRRGHVLLSHSLRTSANFATGAELQRITEEPLAWKLYATMPSRTDRIAKVPSGTSMMGVGAGAVTSTKVEPFVQGVRVVRRGGLEPPRAFAR